MSFVSYIFKIYVSRSVSSHICDKDQEKCDYARSILKKARQGLDWFKPSRRVKVICPILLYYAVEKMVVPDELQAVTYIDLRTDKLPILLQF
jgi:hypothetical protein